MPTEIPDIPSDRPDTPVKKPDYSVKMLDYPLKRPDFPSKLPDNPILSVDIDGTIANIHDRFKMAEEIEPTKNSKFWDLFLSADHYHLDQPIVAARDFLNQFVRENPEFQIVYLSGRRKDTTMETEKWLSDHGFPKGEVLLRPSGNTKWFKQRELKRMKKNHPILAHIGDSDDDENAAIGAGVKAVRVPENGWNTADVLKAIWSDDQ
jgi:acid phosphatase class B